VGTLTKSPESGKVILAEDGVPGTRGVTFYSRYVPLNNQPVQYKLPFQAISLNDKIPETMEGGKMPTYLIQSTLDRMRLRLQDIQKEKLKVAKDLGEAASFGDLSENAEYEAAKERKEMLALEEIRHREWLSDYQLIEELDMPEDIVTLGKKIKIQDRAGDEEMEFVILGEHDRLDNMEIISITAPLVQGLLNKKRGRTAEVRLPRETRRYKILEVTDYFK